MKENYRSEPTPLLFGAPVGVTPSNFAEIFDSRKLVPGLSYSVVCVILCLAFLVQYRRVTNGRTDRRTDGHTYDDSIYRASIASRGKNQARYSNGYY